MNFKHSGALNLQLGFMRRPLLEKHSKHHDVVPFYSMEIPDITTKLNISTFFISFKKNIHIHLEASVVFLKVLPLKNGGCTEFSQWKSPQGCHKPRQTRRSRSSAWITELSPLGIFVGDAGYRDTMRYMFHSKFQNMSISMCFFLSITNFFPLILGHKVWSANVAASQRIITLKWTINIHEPTCSQGPSGDVERFVPSAAAAAAVLYSVGYAAPGLDFAERWDVAAFPTSQR